MSVTLLIIRNSIRVFNAAGYIALGYLEWLDTTLPAFKIRGECPTVAFRPGLPGRSQLSFQINVGLLLGQSNLKAFPTRCYPMNGRNPRIRSQAIAKRPVMFAMRRIAAVRPDPRTPNSRCPAKTIMEISPGVLEATQ
jgi:hypothetical protein